MIMYTTLSRWGDKIAVNTFNGKGDLLEHLEETASDGIDFKFLDCVPCDLEYFPDNSMVIIKGDVVKPTPVDIVKRFEIE